MTGITADSWKRSSSGESMSSAAKIEAVEPGSEVIPKATAKSNPLTSELVMGSGETTTPAEFKNESGMDYSSAIKISSIAEGSKAVKTSVPPSMTPVATPRGNTQPNIVTLPTKFSKVAPPQENGVSTPEIPTFSSRKITPKRNTTLNALGITDLVGN